MVKKMRVVIFFISFLFVILLPGIFITSSFALDREERRKNDLDELQKKFSWWPTDALPGPVKDEARGGYWWWPVEPGKIAPWGNRGYVYVYKIIFDYKAEELPSPQPKELRPSLLIKKILKNIKVYFDYNKADLRQDTIKILDNAVATLKRNPETSILITGNCDIRGSETYNEKLGKHRGETVRKFMLDNGLLENRIRIVSRGKLDAVAPVGDLVGMQKDRNAQFMIAEVQEVMIPYEGQPPEEAKPTAEGQFIEEKNESVESEVKVSTKEYIVQKNDSLWKIAEKELGSGHRWKNLYEFNKDRVKNPNKLKKGQKIIIPVE